MQDETIPVGLCQCGCGEQTAMSDRTDATRGLRKGEPLHYLRGHHRRVRGARDAYRAAWTEAGIEYGLCLCGCGERTRIASSTCIPESRLRGLPCHYVDAGHRNRLGWRVSVEDRGHTTPCHIWQGSCDEHGYGHVWVPEARQVLGAHRVGYERERGPIPEGLWLDHLCRVPPCVNPDHLEPVTPAENMRRGLTAKLTRAEVDEILVATGPQELIAARYGVTQRQVSNIKRGKAWVAP